jgi:arginase
MTMEKRSIAIVGAASSIGIRPYDDGTVRHLDRAPRMLRTLGLVDALGARDFGDVSPPPYVDFVRVGKRPRHESGVAQYSKDLARRVADASAEGSFVLVLGGDCSVVLGCLLGVKQRTSPVGLLYIDAHCDFATPEESRTGSVASMCAALAVGRGNSPLARLTVDPLVQATHLALVGRRDEALGDVYGQSALPKLGVLDLPHHVVRKRGPGTIAAHTLTSLASRGAERFWIHLDADVLDPTVMPAVDSPELNGLLGDELVALLGFLVADPRTIGMELTIYDPGLDGDGSSGRTLVSLLEQSLRTGVTS